MARNIINLDGRFRVTGASAKYSNNYQANPILIPTLVPGGSVGQVLAKASNLSYDVEWVTPSSGGAFTFDNGITELAGVVKFGGNLTQEITVLEGDPILNRSLYFGGNNFLNSVGINCTEDVDIVGNNISTRTIGSNTMGHATEGTLVGVVPTSASPSGVIIRTAKVQSTNTSVGQVLTLKNVSNGEGEWEDVKFTQTFSPTDFINQVLTITAASHGKGVSPMIQVFEGTSTLTVQNITTAGALISIGVAANGDVTLTSTVGNEFNGKIIII